MLQKETIQNDITAIERLICEPLDQHRNERKLNQDEMMVFVNLILTKDDDKIKSMYDDISQQSIVPKAIAARQKAVFNNNMLDEKCLIALTVITEGNIGKAIMYLYFCQWWAFKNGVDPLFFDFETEICQKIFPHGMFNDESMQKIWDATKVTDGRMSGNLIDYSICAGSFINNFNQSNLQSND